MEKVTAEICTGGAPPPGLEGMAGVPGFPPERSVPLKLGKDEPACMKAAAAEPPAEPPAASVQKAGLGVQRRLAARADPIPPQQNFCLHSFIPSPGAKPDADGVFGVVRFRGAFMTDADADAWATDLIRIHGCTSGIYVGYVGRDFPLTESKLDFVPEVREHDLKQKVDRISKDSARAAREDEAKARREIEERQAALVAPPDPDYEKTLHHYTTVQTKIATLKYNLAEIEKKRVELTAVQVQNEKVIRLLNAEFPAFRTQFVGEYELEMEKVGLKDSPLLVYLREQEREQQGLDEEKVAG